MDWEIIKFTDIITKDNSTNKYNITNNSDCVEITKKCKEESKKLIENKLDIKYICNKKTNIHKPIYIYNSNVIYTSKYKL